MAVRNIRNPVQWGWDQLRETDQVVDWMGRAARRTRSSSDAPLPTVRRITVADAKDALRKGFDDFGACRTDVIFLCLIYPVAGLVLAHLAFGYDMVPLLFPLASGFALIGPLAAVGLYEMSRRREAGLDVSWVDAFGVARSPSFGAILTLGLLLIGLFVLWLLTAQAIYNATLGPEPPASVGAFFRDVFTTWTGWALIGLGTGIGFLFALLVLAISVASFPLLLDRQVGIGSAIRTSVRAVLLNPGPMVAWGVIVAGGLVIGTIPLFVGLIVVLPVLGHATWHLYRKLVGPSEATLDRSSVDAGPL